MTTPNTIFRNKKILTVSDDFLIFSKGYRLYRYSLTEKKWKQYSRVKDPVNTIFSLLSITRRLTRAEITKHYFLHDGSEMCIARKGIFRKDKNEKTFKKCFNVVRGSRPMNICIDDDDKMYFGEYFANMEKKAVNVYFSEDDGLNWKIVYTFPEGNINHVHGIFKDPFTGMLWIATGDRENECIIANTSDGFKTLNVVFRGGQDYRTCTLLFYEDFIVFATDSQYQSNHIMKFDRKTLKIDELQSVQGPVIRGGQCGNVAFISTDVEESEVNLDKNVYFWISYDGKKWEQLFSAAKDKLPFLFQFGVFDIPNYYLTKQIDKIYFTGKAVKNYDNQTVSFTIK